MGVCVRVCVQITIGKWLVCYGDPLCILSNEWREINKNCLVSNKINKYKIVINIRIEGTEWRRKETLLNCDDTEQARRGARTLTLKIGDSLAINLSE